jgi:hypothetical protein
LHELLKGAFTAHSLCLRDLENGDFEIKGPDGAVVIPQVWESLAAPGWVITITFLGIIPLKGRRRNYSDSYSSRTSSSASDTSEEESDGDEDNLEDQEIVYDHEVVYTVQTYRKLLHVYEPTHSAFVLYLHFYYVRISSYSTTASYLNIVLISTLLPLL